MSFDGLLVNHGSLEAAAAQLLSSARSIDARLDVLESDLRPLRSGWSGQAQLSYVQAKSTWDTAIAEMIVLLSQVSGLVSHANAEYRGADLRGAQRFG